MQVTPVQAKHTVSELTWGDRSGQF